MAPGPDNDPAPAAPGRGDPADMADDSETDFVEDGDVTQARDGGVLKEIIAKGTGWQRAEVGDEVSMMYKGALADGTVFDSSYDRGAPFTFKLGADSVIKGWEIVARTMAKGEKARVTLAPEYAYGAKGSPPKIPPNATLVFDMELIEFHSKKDVFGDGSVIKTEIEAGAGWERPARLSKVQLTVTACAFASPTSDKASTASDPPQHVGGADKGTILLADSKRSFMLGAGQMPEAWEKVVPDMKKDAKVHLVCKEPRLLGPGLDKDLGALLPSGTVRVEYTVTLDTWVKVEIVSASDSSIIKQILAEGDGWERPNEGATVVVDVAYFKAPDAASTVTTKIDADAVIIAAATAFDEKTHPFFEQTGLKFTLGDGAVMDGLDQAIQTMKAKEAARITIVPSMAYELAPMLLPPNAASSVKITDSIMVAVKLLSFEKSKDMWSMSFEEKADEMMSRKLKGNEMFKANRIHPAIKAYERAIALFDSPTSELSPELKKHVNQLLVQCNVNLAVCYERKKDMTKVLSHCKKALELEPSNVKALYRRGSAYMALEDFYNAESDLKYALHLSPENADVKRKLKLLSELQSRQDAKDKKLFSNLFGRLSAMEEKERRKNPDAFRFEEPRATEFKDDDDDDDDDDFDGDDDEDDEDELEDEDIEDGKMNELEGKGLDSDKPGHPVDVEMKAVEKK
jgi:FK506-binding protein 4/5